MNTASLICGFPIANSGSDEILSDILSRARNRFGGWVVTLNLEMLSKIDQEADYRQLLDKADLYIADGMPLVWASSHGRNRKNDPIKERTTGVDIVDRILSRDTIPNFAIIGGDGPKKTLERYPGSVNACKFLFDGVVNLSDQQTQEFADEIHKNNIEVVFLALGVPKQDSLALALRELVPGSVYIGVGGSFKMLGPSGKRAPVWMQKTGTEWVYRLTSEPKRLWKRYLGNYPVGALYLLKDTFFRRNA